MMRSRCLLMVVLALSLAACAADNSARRDVIGDDSGSSGGNGSDADADADNDSDGDTDISDDGSTSNPEADSDGDGLSDKWEEQNGTDPNNPDTDGDGVSDLAEVVAGTDPKDPGSNPQKQGNFYFLVPYQAEPSPLKDALVFSTDIQMADLFILEDTTGSMSMAISQLKRDLRKVIIPQAATIIPDIWFGVGRFDDYPTGGYGGTGDMVFELMTRTTDDPAKAQAAVNLLHVNDGQDTPESQVAAMWATATGKGLGTYLADATGCASDEIGYPCFRKGAVPILMLISDAPFHNGPSSYSPYTGITPVPPVYAEAVQALNDIHARVIGIKVAPPMNIGGAIVTTHMNKIATDTGTVDGSGKPLVFDVTFAGAGLGSDIVNAIATLAKQVPMAISAKARDDTSDAVDATVFIDHIEPNTTGGKPDPQDPTKICVDGLSTSDSDGDGVADQFPAVAPGTPVCFDIIVRKNVTVPATSKPEVYKAFVDVMGDQSTVLDTREVFFLVPPSTPIQ